MAGTSRYDPTRLALPLPPEPTTATAVRPLPNNHHQEDQIEIVQIEMTAFNGQTACAIHGGGAGGLRVLQHPPHPDDDPQAPSILDQYQEKRSLALRVYRVYRKIELGFALFVLYALVAAIMFIHASWGAALPDASDEFDLMWSTGWMNTIFMAGVACSVGFMGKLYRVVCPSYIWMFSTAGLVGLMYVSGMPRGPVVFIVCRGLTGFLASASLIGTFYLADRILFRSSKYDVYMLLFSTSLLAGYVAGATIGPVITADWGYRMMYQSMTVAFAALEISAFATVRKIVMCEYSGASILARARKVKVLELFMMPILLMPVVLLNIVATWETTTDFHVGILCAFALVANLTYICMHYRFGHLSNVPRHFIAKPTIWAAAGVTFFIGGSISVTTVYLPVYFQVGKFVTPRAVGEYMVYYECSLVAGVLIGCLGGTVRRKKFTHVFLTVLGSTIAAIGSSLIKLYTDPTSSMQLLINLPIPIGVGLGMAIVQPPLNLHQTLHPTDLPAAYILLLLCFAFGSALSLAAANVMYQQRIIRYMSDFLDRERILTTGMGIFPWRYKEEIVKIWWESYIRTCGYALAAVGALLSGLAVIWTLVANFKTFKTHVEANYNTDGDQYETDNGNGEPVRQNNFQGIVQNYVDRQVDQSAAAGNGHGDGNPPPGAHLFQFAFPPQAAAAPQGHGQVHGQQGGGQGGGQNV